MLGIGCLQALAVAQRHVANTNALVRATGALAQVPLLADGEAFDVAAQRERPSLLPPAASIAIARLSERLMGRCTCRVFIVHRDTGTLVAYVECTLTACDAGAHHRVDSSPD